MNWRVSEGKPSKQDKEFQHTIENDSFRSAELICLNSYVDSKNEIFLVLLKKLRERHAKFLNDNGYS